MTRNRTRGPCYCADSSTGCRMNAAYWARYGAFLAVVVLGLVSSSIFVVDSGQAASPQANAVVLLPAGIGPRHVKRRWHNLLPGHTIEEGASYAGAADVPPVQLDFYRNSLMRHNGAKCYMVQGESLLWDRPAVLKTLGGSPEFDVVLLRGQNQLRIVAATECAVNGCADSDSSDPLGESARLLLMHDWGSKPLAFVPVSVVMVRTVVDPAAEEAIGAEMGARCCSGTGQAAGSRPRSHRRTRRSSNRHRPASANVLGAPRVLHQHEPVTDRNSKRWMPDGLCSPDTLERAAPGRQAQMSEPGHRGRWPAVLGYCTHPRSVSSATRPAAP